MGGDVALVHPRADSSVYPCSTRISWPVLDDRPLVGPLSRPPGRFKIRLGSGGVKGGWSPPVYSPCIRVYLRGTSRGCFVWAGRLAAVQRGGHKAEDLVGEAGYAGPAEQCG